MLFFSYTPSGLPFLGYPTQGSTSLHPWATILRRFAAQKLYPRLQGSMWTILGLARVSPVVYSSATKLTSANVSPFSDARRCTRRLDREIIDLCNYRHQSKAAEYDGSRAMESRTSRVEPWNLWP